MNLEQYAVRLLIEAWDAYPDPTGILAATLPADELALEDQVTVTADMAGMLLGLLKRATEQNPDVMKMVDGYVRILRGSIPWGA